MKFSSKSKYGIKAMVDLASCPEGQLTPIKIIAERQNIPDSYLEQLFSSLKKAQLVTSVKGPHGGYKLNKKASEISAAEVIRALDGAFSVLNSKDQVTLHDDPLGYCINTTLWEGLDNHVSDYLENISLNNLLKEYEKRINTDSYMYYI